MDLNYDQESFQKSKTSWTQNLTSLFITPVEVYHWAQQRSLERDHLLKNNDNSV